MRLHDQPISDHALFSAEGPSDPVGRTGWRLIAAVVVIGLGMSLGLAGFLRAQVESESRENLATHGEFLAGAMKSDIQLVAEQVRGLRGMFEASHSVTDEQFRLEG